MGSEEQYVVLGHDGSQTTVEICYDANHIPPVWLVERDWEVYPPGPMMQHHWLIVGGGLSPAPKTVDRKTLLQAVAECWVVWQKYKKLVSTPSD